MSFVVIYDASVLYPSTLRDLLIRLAQTRLVRARWTDQILDEMFAALKHDRPDLDSDRLARTRYLIDDVLDRLERNGLPISVAELRTPR